MVDALSRMRMLGAAAAVVAAAGLVAVVTKDEASRCDGLEARLTAIEDRYGFGSAQSWDDILVLQESAVISDAYRANDERQQILRDLEAQGCASDVGSLASATVAVRAACREFFAQDSANFDVLLSSDELAQKCDEPAIEWRSDCYAERPPAFVAGEGGCAYLGGYLAVWHGRQSFSEPHWLFEVGDEVWTVIPESD